MKQAQRINCPEHIMHSNQVDIARYPVLVWHQCKRSFNCIFRFCLKLNVVAPDVIMIALKLQPIDFVNRSRKKSGLDLWRSVGRKQEKYESAS